MTHVTSAVHGPIDPLDPAPLTGLFPFTVRNTPIDIPAPAAAVWAVLTDLDAYPEWCPFTRRIETDWVLGHDVTLHLDWQVDRLGEPTQTQAEKLTIFEPNVALAWGGAMLGGLVAFERVQYLEPTDAGVRYHTFDRLSGLLAPPTRWFFEARMQAGFDAVGPALRARVLSR